LQNPTTVTVAHDTTEAVEEAVNFLEKDSRWETPAFHFNNRINIRMIQIPFTIIL
jgi:hypothetical protein